MLFSNKEHVMQKDEYNILDMYLDIAEEQQVLYV